MKKLTKLFVLCSSLTLLPLASCQNKSDDSQEIDPSKTNFDDVIFQDKKVEYDGGYHSLAPVNLPINTTVTYVGQSSFTEVGRYEINIILKKEGYNDRKMTAILRITYPTIKDVTVLNPNTIVYDGANHINDIKLVFGEEPEGLETEIFVKKNGKNVTEVKNVGVYNFHFVLRAPKHEDSHIYADLEISGKEMDIKLSREHLDVAYDGLDHKDDFKFSAPLGFSYEKTLKSIKNQEGLTVSEAKEIGEYTFTFEVKAENYKTKTLNGTMSIFDGTHIKNKLNNIQTTSYRDNANTINKLVFMSLHEDGKLYLLDKKDNDPVLLYDDEVLDYKLTSNLIFIKTLDNLIKYKKLNDLDKPWENFKDQTANMDFVLVQNKHLVYTRIKDSKTEICKIEGSGGNVTTLYSQTSISDLQVSQNKVYFLEKNITNIVGTIKSFSLFEGQSSVTPLIVNPDINNALSFSINNGSVYYLGVSITNLTTINSFSLFGDKKIKTLVSVAGTDIEYFASGDYLFYKYSELDIANPSLEKPTKGIYKRNLSIDKDYLLLDTSKLDFRINGLALFDDQIYFSNKSSKDCHVYSIPSFGESKDITLVR